MAIAAPRIRRSSSCPMVTMSRPWNRIWPADRKSTRLNSSHTEIYTLSLHDALPICHGLLINHGDRRAADPAQFLLSHGHDVAPLEQDMACRSEEHTSELQSHRDLHSFPTRRSSDLPWALDKSWRSPRRGSGAVPPVPWSRCRAPGTGYGL